MESVLLPIIYAITFASQLVLLVRTVKNPTLKRFAITVFVELLSIFLIILLLFYYNSLPQSGFMPGLRYLSEIFCSIIAGAAYIVLLIVSVVVYFIARKVRNSQNTPDV